MTAKKSVKKTAKKSAISKKTSKTKKAKNTPKKSNKIKQKAIADISTATPSMKSVKVKNFKKLLQTIILFSIIFILSTILYSISGEEIYKSLFFLLALLFGFSVIAMFIVLLTIEFLRFLRKKQ